MPVNVRCYSLVGSQSSTQNVRRSIRARFKVNYAQVHPSIGRLTRPQPGRLSLSAIGPNISKWGDRCHQTVGELALSPQPPLANGSSRRYNCASAEIQRSRMAHASSSERPCWPAQFNRRFAC